MGFSRRTSFIFVTMVYILAIIAGFAAYMICPGMLWVRLLVADAVSTVITFIFSVIFDNASVYDPYWSVQPIVIMAAFACAYGICTSSLLLMMVVFIWGVRLTANWAYTFHGLDHQDWRYTMLKEKTGSFYPVINFIGIHMVPTLIVYMAVFPAVCVIQNNAEFKALSLIGAVISLLAVVLQATSDYQMHSYRKNKTTPFINTGLWKHSRHPNYLGEILMWWGVALYAVATIGFKWYLLAGALANTLLFLFVSIPMAEGKQKKKPGYGEYKARTRMLLPIKKL